LKLLDPRLAAPEEKSKSACRKPKNPRMPSTAFAELAGLRATVDQVLYKPQLEAPPDRPYPFAYFITIHNDAGEGFTIKARKWVLTDTENRRTVLECEGIDGRFPRIAPGESFSFHHYHVVGSDSRAEGAFFGVTDNGEPVFTRIPQFDMRTPRE
jgi:ApaG protein